MYQLNKKWVPPNGKRPVDQISSQHNKLCGMRANLNVSAQQIRFLEDLESSTNHLMMGQKQTMNHADVRTKGIRVGHGSKPQQVARLDSFVEKISSVTILIETALPNSDFMDVWQSGKRSGGVAVFSFLRMYFRANRCHLVIAHPLNTYSTVLKCTPRVLLLIIYRPSKYSENFFHDFTELGLLSSISTDVDCFWL